MQARYKSHAVTTQHKQQYGLHLRKIDHTNLPREGFELGSLGPQESMLSIEPPLLVTI